MTICCNENVFFKNSRLIMILFNLNVKVTFKQGFDIKPSLYVESLLRTLGRVGYIIVY